MGADNAEYTDFLAFSSTLTGFTAFELKGTGQANAYFSTVRSIVGDDIFAELLDTFRRVGNEAGGDEDDLARALRREILSDEKLGPVTRHIIKLWYVGIWYELPFEWQERFGSSEEDRTFVISPESYQEGLLWPAIGANPSGAKPFGYGMWATPPHVGTSFDKD